MVMFHFRKLQILTTLLLLTFSSSLCPEEINPKLGRLFHARNLNPYARTIKGPKHNTHKKDFISLKSLNTEIWAQHTGFNKN